MFEITILVAVVLVVLAVPSLRRAALSFLGLVAIIVGGSAVVAVVVWALYQAKPWLTPDAPAVAEKAVAPAAQGSIPGETEEADLAAAITSEEQQRRREEQQLLEAAQARIAGLVAGARAILEDDRLLAEQAAAYPLPSGVGSRFGNIVAIRVPAWRDGDVAAREQESIRVWLQSIGLTAEETTSITTARAWGGLHDMWVAETTGVAPPSLQGTEPTVAPDPAATESESESEAEPATEPEPRSGTNADSVAEPVAQPAPPPIQPRPFPAREAVRPAPPRRVVDYPPSPPPPPRRQPSAQPEAGPFGY